MPKRKSGKRSKASKFVDSQPAVVSKLGFSPVPETLLPVQQWPDVCQALQGKTEKAIRVRLAAALGTATPLEIPFQTDRIPWFDAGRFALDTHQPGRYLQHAAGAYFVQDAGSLLALKLLDAQPDEIIADVCAAPGGKATSILETVGPGTGFLLANEPIRGRAAALQWTLSRVGYSRFATSQYDVERLAERLAGCFDKVLVDAPCSGQTLVGRGKQSFAAFDISQIQHSAARQMRIIRGAAQLVRPGGRLVYSTCTFAAEENEHVAKGLMDEDSGWRVVEVEELRDWASPMEPGGYRLWPHRDRCAGAYAICLEKVNSGMGPYSSGASPEPYFEDLSSEDLNRKDHNKKSTSSVTSAKLPGEIQDLLGQVGSLTDFIAIEGGRQWYSIPSDAPDWLDQIHFAGSEIAYQPAKVWLPAHSLGLRRESTWRPSNIVELDNVEAQRFLQGLTLDAKAAGWSVVTWCGHPLGWVHSNQQRANNSLPQAARLTYIAPFA